MTPLVRSVRPSRPLARGSAWFSRPTSDPATRGSSPPRSSAWRRSLTARADDDPARRWSLRLEVDEPGSMVAAALDEVGSMIGLATAGATRDEHALTAWELYSINVAFEQQGDRKST